MSKKIGFIAVFFITACLSFFITKKIKEGKENNPLEITQLPKTTPTTSGPAKQIESNDVVKVDSSNKIETKVESQSEAPAPQESQITLKATKPVKNNNGYYSFTASVDRAPNESYHYELWSNRLVAKSQDGSFSKIPPIKSGKYKLCLVSNAKGTNMTTPITINGFITEEVSTVEETTSEKGNEEKVETQQKEKQQKKLITEEEFQRRMLNKADRSLNGGKKSPVTKGFRVVVVNPNPDEGEGSFEVSDIQDVRDMIHTYNKWKSARVVELEYDATGHVTLAKVQAVY